MLHDTETRKTRLMVDLASMQTYTFIFIFSIISELNRVSSNVIGSEIHYIYDAI